MDKKQYYREYMRNRRAGKKTSKENGLSYLISQLEWKDIPEYPGYQASACGQIKSCRKEFTRTNNRKHVIPEKVLKQNPDTKDRLQVGTYKDKKRITESVHKLVYLAWKGPISDKLVIDHIDGNHRNNHKDNLQLLTVGQNNSKGYQDAYNKGFQAGYQAAVDFFIMQGYISPQEVEREGICDTDVM